MSKPFLFHGNERILLTGGTGSLGKRFISRALEHIPHGTICIFSRDEYKQHEMRQNGYNDPRLRWFVGCVRDRERVMRAMDRVTLVVHAAAMKQVATGIEHDIEVVKTNIHGTMSVIDAAVAHNSVRKMVFISSDKAVEPVNLYGMTKAVGEHMTREAGKYTRRHCEFCAVRYGNVIGSRGSVIEKWRNGGAVSLTKGSMTRFWLTLDDAVDLIFHAIQHGQSGDVFIPKAKACDMRTVARVLSVTPGEPAEHGMGWTEKEHECLVGWEESAYCADRDGPYLRINKAHEQGKRFCMTSDGVESPMTDDEFRRVVGR